MAQPLQLPTHLAIILDGNGRKATQNGFERLIGHRQGAVALERTMRLCVKHGISHLTVFAFATKNWSRDIVEVTGLMRLFARFIREKEESLIRNGVRVRFIGNREDGKREDGNLPSSLLASMHRLEHITGNNSRLHLTIAINYDGQDEIRRAVSKALANESFEITQFLDTADLPNPDLVIRTGVDNPVGSVWRDSGFLIMQTAHSVKVPLPVLWPDFAEEHLLEACARWRAEAHLNGGQRPATQAIS